MIICSTEYSRHRIFDSFSESFNISEMKQPHYCKVSATVGGRLVDCGLLMRVSMQSSVIYYLRAEFLLCNSIGVNL